MAAFFIQTSGMIVGDTAIPLAMVGIGAMLGNLIGGQMALWKISNFIESMRFHEQYRCPYKCPVAEWLS